MPTIPEPELVADEIVGQLYTLSGGTLLSIGAASASLSGIMPTISGRFFVRYGISLLSPPGDVIVPGLFAAETGGILVGRVAWDYLWSHFQVHPRADVVGLRLNGERTQVFVRDLDLGVVVHVLAYESALATIPMAEITGLLIGEGMPDLPALLAQYLPIVNDVEPFLKQ